MESDLINKSDYGCYRSDIGMHSATKFIAGHSDVMVGVLAVKEERLRRNWFLEGRLQLSAMQFRMNCLGQWNMDASASVTADYITDHFTEVDVEDWSLAFQHFW
ncbi:hypothetical protein V6N13_103718 [Hibiscus sabdariffa]|uniref:Cystathionine beta-lyase n=1 Tax=Hibiscus sabdariffa TaxID=183260 RepID=A0ABR2BSK2_9ROSI